MRSLPAASRGRTPSAASRWHWRDAADVVRERAGEPRRGVAPRPPLSLEDRLARLQRARGVALRPGVGERERRRLGERRDERLDLALADRLAAGPRRELVDLVGELVQVVADELDERGAGLGLGAGAGELELLRDPLRELPLGDREGEHLPDLRDRLRERRVGLQLLRDEREHGSRRRAREVRRDRLDVRGLPLVDRLRRRRAAPRRRRSRGSCRRRPRPRPSPAARRRARPSPRRPGARRRCRARPIFGRSVPVSR